MQLRAQTAVVLRLLGAIVAFTRYALTFALIVIEALAVPIVEALGRNSPLTKAGNRTVAAGGVDILLRPALDIFVLRHGCSACGVFAVKWSGRANFLQNLKSSTLAALT